VAESLGAAVLTVSVDDAQLKAGLQAAERQASTTGQNIEKGLNRSGKAVSTAANGLQYYIDAQGRAREASGRFLSLAQRQAAGIEDLGKSATSAGSNLSGLGTALAGLGAGAALTGFLRGSINAAVELDSITRKLSNTLGEQGAGRALSFTRGLSDQLGLSFKTLASSFGSFTAAATAANVPLQEQEQLFAAVSKAAQALGLSNDEINGSLLALQQVAAKGTVQMEELRGQLGERLPIAFGATARGLGITQQELIKLVETGQLTASQFFPALTKGLNELTAGAGGTETAAQNFQKLANAWDALQTSFGTSLLPTIIEQVKNLTGALDGLKIGIDANKLGLGGLFGNLGLVPDAGIEAAASVRQLATDYNLTAKQARALFFDAAKLEGLKLTSTGFLPDGRGLERTLARLPELAEAFRAKNVDATSELKAQEAEAAKLLALSKKQSEEEQKALNAKLRRDEANLEIKGIEANIAAARDLATLEGTALVRLQVRLGIEEKLRQERIAQLRLQRELAKPVGDGRGNTRTAESVDKLIIEQEKANANVRLAYAEAGASLARNAKAAADSLRSAQDNVQSVLRGGFEFLSPALQRQQLAQARAAVDPLIARGVIRQNIDISSPERLLQVAGFAESFTKAENDLNTAIVENTKAQQELLKKDWTVLVNVPGGNAFGDVVREGVYQ
jgi:tape measure domain-containing protein